MLNFIQQVKIFGWNTHEWVLLKEDGLIFDSTRNLPARNLEVEFDSGNYRRFKVELNEPAWNDRPKSDASKSNESASKPLKQPKIQPS